MHVVPSLLLSMAWRMNKAREGQKHCITGFLRLVRIKCLPALIHHHPWMGYFNEQRRKPSSRKAHFPFNRPSFPCQSISC